MDYKKRLKKEMRIGIALIIVSAVMRLACIFNNEYVFMPLSSSYCLGAGLGLFSKALICLKNKKFAQRHEINDTDERNVIIYKKAGSMTAIICFAITCIAGVVFDIMEMREFARVMGIAVVIYIIVYCVSWMVYYKKM